MTRHDTGKPWWPVTAQFTSRRAEQRRQGRKLVGDGVVADNDWARVPGLWSGWPMAVGARQGSFRDRERRRQDIGMVARDGRAAHLRLTPADWQCCLAGEER